MSDGNSFYMEDSGSVGEPVRPLPFAEWNCVHKPIDRARGEREVRHRRSATSIVVKEFKRRRDAFVGKGKRWWNIVPIVPDVKTTVFFRKERKPPWPKATFHGLGGGGAG